MGCTHTATPDAALSTLATMAGTLKPDGLGYGADVILEMVGHNTETIELAIDLAKPSATIVCFGVPDDEYKFIPHNLSAWPILPT